MGFFDFLGGGGDGASMALSDQTYGQDAGGMSMNVPGGATGYADPMTNPSGNPNVELGGSQGVGLLGKLGRYAQMLKGALPGSTAPGTPPTSGGTQPSHGTGPAAQPAAANVSWDNTAPDAFAAADRDRRQLGMYAQLGHDIAMWAKTAATAGAGGMGGGGGMGGI